MWYEAANNLDPALERPLISLSGLSAKSPTHLGARRGLCVLTIRSRSYRILLLVSACYPYQEIALPEDFSDEEMARDWTLSVVTALSSTARRSAFVSTAPSSCVRCDCTVDFLDDVRELSPPAYALL